MNSKATTSRRSFLKASSLVFSYTVAGVSMQLTPAAARAADAELRLLSRTDAEVLETIAESICPGARRAGIAHFLDSQLAVEPTESLLMLRYLGVAAPYEDFYLAAINSLKVALGVDEKTSISTIESAKIAQLIAQLGTDKVADWAGPPASFFYFVLRSDAVDVTYGTEAGFADLGIPYLAHISPPTPW